MFVGVSQFEDSRFADVPFAADDAVDLAHLFCFELGLIRPEKALIALAGEPRKPESIERLRALLAAGTRRISARQADVYSQLETQARISAAPGLLLVTFSTHGYSDQGADYLMATDSLIRRAVRTGIAVHEVFDDVARARAPRRLVLLDACRERLSKGTRSIVPALESAMSKGFAAAIAKATGQVVLAGAPLGGFAYDDSERGNGVFTATIIDGLRGAAPADETGLITVRALADFVEQRVAEWIRDFRPEHGEPSGGLARRIEGPAEGLPLAIAPGFLEVRQPSIAHGQEEIETAAEPATKDIARSGLRLGWVWAALAVILASGLLTWPWTFEDPEKPLLERRTASEERWSTKAPEPEEPPSTAASSVVGQRPEGKGDGLERTEQGLSATRARDSEAAAHSRAAVGYVVQSSGKVELKRATWASFHPVQAGAPLAQNDQIKLAADAEVIVVCADFVTIWNPTRGERSAISQGCKKTSPSVLELAGGLTLGTRGEEPSERILSPRGLIRDPTPILRWEPLGGHEHEVKISVAEETIWGPVLVVGNEQKMPAGFLERQTQYRLQVRSAGSRDFIEATIPFSIITENQHLEIAEREKALLGLLERSAAGRELAHVLLLTYENLKDEALALLDQALPTLESGAAELLGAHLALRLDLRDRAAKKYEKARLLSESHGDEESTAEAWIGLARVAEKRVLVEQRLKPALELYGELGDHERLKELKKEFDYDP